MGKKSLIKSTAKKKSETKKEGEKTTQQAAATAKKAPAKAPKKSSSKAEPKAKTQAEPKAHKKTQAAPQTKPAPKKRSIKELTFLKFKALKPAAKKLAAPKPAAVSPTAPPLITVKDANEVQRLRSLLAKKFNMAEIKASAKAPAPPTRAKAQAAAQVKPAMKKRSIKELTFLKFEALTPVAKKPAAPKPAAASPTAPPLIAVTDTNEVQRLRTILAKKFNMTEIKASAKAPAPTTSVMGTPKLEAAQTKTEPEVKTAQKDAPKQAAPKPVEKSAYITVESDRPEPQADPFTRSIKIAAAAAILLVIILLAVSANNSGKYYIKPIDNAIEIWKGDFSPKDKEFFMVLHGIQAPEPLKEVYSKQEVFPLIFNYYIDKSDTLLEVKGLPDFEGIKKYLHQAERFAVTNDMKIAAIDRLNSIERMILLYKADVAASRNTVDSLESAIKILKDASRLTPSAIQAEEIAQKIEAAREGIKALKAEAGGQVPEKQ